MSCGEIKEKSISTNQFEVVGVNKCLFLNLCYPKNNNDPGVFNLGSTTTPVCRNKTIHYNFIEFNKDLLNLFPTGYVESDLIGKIYKFEIYLEATHWNKKLIFYFMFIPADGNVNQDEMKKFKCVRGEGDIPIIKNSDIIQETCVRLEDVKIFIKGISFIGEKNEQNTQYVVPGFGNIGGSKTRKNKKTKTRKNKKRKSIKKKK